MASFAGDTPCWIPDVPTERSDEQRIRIAQFGDGYAQRTLDGINSLNRKWSVTFTNRKASIITSMVNYLVGRKGNAFAYYEQQTKQTFNVWCDAWDVNWSIRRTNIDPKTGLSFPIYYGTLTAEFEVAYGVTA